MSAPKVTTNLATSTPDDVFLRGRSLKGMIGHVGFTELMFLHIVGREPTPGQTAMLDGCLVALMEHGLTPSALSARLTLGSAPEALQGAVAAGLLGVGGVFAGTMEGCGALLARIAAAGDPAAEAREVVTSLRATRSPVPGFGHPLHKPEDPRAIALLALADAQGVAGRHVAALRVLAEAVDAALGRHVPINATGAIAATLADCGVPVEILRGFAVISRCVGLVGHLREEQERPAMRAIWEAAERAVPYEDPGD